MKTTILFAYILLVVISLVLFLFKNKIFRHINKPEKDALTDFFFAKRNMIAGIFIYFLIILIPFISAKFSQVDFCRKYENQDTRTVSVTHIVSSNKKLDSEQ